MVPEDVSSVQVPLETLALVSIEVREPSRRIFPVIGTGLVGALVAGVGMALVGIAGAYVGALVGALLLPLALRSGVRHLPASELIVEPDAVRLPALARTLRPADVRSAYEVPSERGLVLDLTDGTALFLRFAEHRFERVAAVLGVAPAQRTLVVPLRRMLGAFTLGLVTFIASLLAAGLLAIIAAILISGTAAFVVIAALPILATILVVRRFGAPRVEVGTDGVRVLGLWRQTFVAHRDVLRVNHARTPGAHGGASVVIERATGAAVHLPLVAATSDRIEGLVQRLETASAITARARAIDALGRNGRPLDTWRAGAQALATRETSFRDAPVTREDLEALLKDPTSPAEQRVGAAMAVRAMVGDAGRARVRVVASATADEHLRVALEQAADGTLDEAVMARLPGR